MSATLHTTLGDLKLELACDDVPRLCENWLKHAAMGTYDGVKFHRNIAGFLVQGGDPTGTGKGGEAAEGGKLADEFHPDLKHDSRGVVAFASNGPNTIGSQFYIAYGPQPSLDGVYCVIGRLIDGETVLDAIERAPVGAKHRPVTDIKIVSITIHANPIAEEALRS
jgi:peptidyl-prolyl cis-trans isomerase-like 3